MEYALLIYGDEKTWASWDDDQRKAHAERHGQFVAMLNQRGAMRAGKELAIAGTATTLRRRGEEVSVTDGPFAETAEVLGGFYLIEAPDLDAAIELAGQLPEQVVEIRPVLPAPGDAS